MAPTLNDERSRAPLIDQHFALQVRKSCFRKKLCRANKSLTLLKYFKVKAPQYIGREKHVRGKASA
jgi:hypothetical protein